MQQQLITKNEFRAIVKSVMPHVRLSYSGTATAHTYSGFHMGNITLDEYRVIEQALLPYTFTFLAGWDTH